MSTQTPNLKCMHWVKSKKSSKTSPCCKTCLELHGISIKRHHVAFIVQVQVKEKRGVFRLAAVDRLHVTIYWMLWKALIMRMNFEEKNLLIVILCKHQTWMGTHSHRF